MSATPESKHIDAVILCGGFGKRLRGVVNDRPKPMAEINGTPFLEILINHVASYGLQRFILCTGYKSQFIKQHYQNRNSGRTILVSEEKGQLGTGGAIKNAEPFIQSKPFLVLNGDSFCRINIQDFLDFHTRKKAIVSIALTAVGRAVDSGIVKLDEYQKIISFNEKAQMDEPCLVNAGVYLFDKTVLGQMPTGKEFSLEHDFFPRILGKGIYGYVTDERLLDIGTPERLESARQYFAYFSKGEKGAGVEKKKT